MRSSLKILLWTLVLAIPCTALALTATALFTDHIPEIATAVRAQDWGALTSEAAARWPEIAGMVIGQLVLMALILVVRRSEPARDRA